MNPTISLAYCIVLLYFLIERALRKGKQSLSLEPGQSDHGSSYLLLSVGLTSLGVILLAPTLNSHDIGYLSSSYVGWIGISLMAAGLAIRYWAAKTLGEFYTRTLRILDKHSVVQAGPYRTIRHPGYLGTLLIGIGFGLAVSNWIVFLILLITELAAKLYRIRVEEKMLQDALGEPYEAYSTNTWRLVPFVY